MMFPGNPAVYIRSVAFRPCLATGLALLREVTYFKRLYDDVSGLSNFRETIRESFGSVKIGPVAMSFRSKNGRIAWCSVAKQGPVCRNLSARERDHPAQFSEPDFHFVLQEFFNSGNRHLTAVKDAGRQGRFGCGFGKDLQEMVCTTGSAGGDNGNRDRLLDRIDQLDVESEPGAVSIDTVQQDFTCPQIFAGPGQGYGVQVPSFPSALYSALVPAISSRHRDLVYSFQSPGA